jgi:hypothetical protein
MATRLPKRTMTEGKQFTLGGDPAEEDSQDDEAETTTTTAGGTSSTTSQPANVSEHTCDEAVQEWLDSLADDAAYGYVQLTVTIKQEVDATKYSIRRSHESSESYTQFSQLFSHGGTPEKGLRAGFRALFDAYSTPIIDDSRYPVGRTIPHENLRLFVPEKMFDIADVEQTVVEDLLDAFYSMDEYSATPAVQRLHERQYRLNQLSTRREDGSLHPALQLVKNTIRYKLGISGKYRGGEETRELPHKTIDGIPEADPQYEDWSLNELGAELDHIRENIGQAQVELEQVRDDIAEQTLTPDDVKQQVLAKTAFDAPAFLGD